MRILMVSFSIWFLRDILALAQYHDIEVARRDLDPFAKTTSNDIPPVLLRRSPGSRSPASTQGASKQHTSSDLNSGSPRSSRASSQSRPAVIKATPNDPNDQIPKQRESRPVNRNSGTLKDLVRSASPPQERGYMPWRSRSSSPPIARKIQLRTHHFADPADPSPAKASIGVLGPGFITHRLPSGGSSHIIVPPKKAIIQEEDHSSVTTLKGKVFSQGSIHAGASGVKSMSSLKLRKGHGLQIVNNDAAKKVYNFGPHSHTETWLQQVPWRRGPVTTETYVYGEGEVMVAACNNPNWCNHVWEGRGQRRPD